jgi:hypothetical protein
LKPFPDVWLGVWRSGDGRALRIERDDVSLCVTASPDETSPPYAQPSGERLAAEWMDTESGSVLRVEIGSAVGLTGLGPTYDLAFKRGDRGARVEDDPAVIHIEPAVGMGLYDDFEADLGVPWAFPLARFVKR